jgi:hypothetical protein
MSKKNRAGQAAAHQLSRLDRLARWLARRSRLARSVIAGLVALVLTGALGVFIYGFLFALPVGSLNIGSLKPADLVTGLFMVLAVIGLVLYWVGWRVLIGFDFGETALEPGRPAAIWVLIGVAVLVITLLIALINTLVALSPT